MKLILPYRLSEEISASFNLLYEIIFSKKKKRLKYMMYGENAFGQGH